MDGLRILARIIARHYLAHPELYPQPVDAAEWPPSSEGQRAEAAGGCGVRRVKPAFRARLDPDQAWERLSVLNMSQNQLARRIGQVTGASSQTCSTEDATPPARPAAA